MDVIGGNAPTGRLRIEAGRPQALQIGRDHPIPLVQIAGFSIVDRRTVSPISKIERGRLIAEVVFRTGRRLLVAGTPGELSALRDAVYRGMDADLDGPTLPMPFISKV